MVSLLLALLLGCSKHDFNCTVPFDEAYRYACT